MPTMMTIWKFTIPITDEITLQMPVGAEVLSVGVQRDVVCVWALVTQYNPYETRYFRLFGTGHPVEGQGRFVGTFMIEGGDLVFHLFEGLR